MKAKDKRNDSSIRSMKFSVRLRVCRRGIELLCSVTVSVILYFDLLLLEDVGGIAFQDGAFEELCGLLISNSSGFTDNGH